ncbi:hypothetical protein EYF80_048372 [Liparis tanakae]|uniref:Uncharacterized protein n=1 Tax=Liparis tanakae TaxID=230148 RepID=A0A4Z2FJS5_9TELE|nr:hypothetical protein EYF80_048372 [Liparis tanakae]
MMGSVRRRIIIENFNERYSQRSACGEASRHANKENVATLKILRVCDGGLELLLQASLLEEAELLGAPLWRTGRGYITRPFVYETHARAAEHGTFDFARHLKITDLKITDLEKIPGGKQHVFSAAEPVDLQPRPRGRSRGHVGGAEATWAEPRPRGRSRLLVDELLQAPPQVAQVADLDVEDFDGAPDLDLRPALLLPAGRQRLLGRLDAMLQVQVLALQLLQTRSGTCTRSQVLSEEAQRRLEAHNTLAHICFLAL